MSAAPPKSIGTYEVLGKIAEGGMGAVYKARNPSTGELVAIKVVPPETAKNPLLVKRFEQEFRAASLIDHPNVVKAIEYGDGPSPYLVMEFVDGESLGQKVDRLGRLTEAEAVRLIGQVCEGLHRAHKQGLIHRDVKPDNILVTKNGTAKLTDLGLVKDIEATGEMSLTRTGRGLGTPHFMAPEQFRNAKNADVRCDVYSLGATLYTLLTGEVPFKNTNPLDCWMKKTKSDFPAPKELVPTLGDRLDWAIRRAMHHDPSKRPANCREFMEDLTGVSWRTGASGSFTTPPPADVEDLPAPLAEATDLWYMVFKGTDGQMKTVKGTTESIRRNADGGLIGPLASVLVCRTKHGQFRPLREVAEFRDLVPAPDDTPPPTSPAQQPRPQPPSGRYVVAPNAAANLSGSFAVAPTEAMPAAQVMAGDTTVAYTVTPITIPSHIDRVPTTVKSPVWQYLPWVLLSILAAGLGAGVTLLLK